IARLTTALLLDEFASAGNPLGITSGPDGAIWFTEFGGNKIERDVLPMNRPTVGPAAGRGLNQGMDVGFTDAAGGSSMSVVNVLINNFLDGRNACYLAYVVPDNILYLVNDAGDAGGPFAGSLVLNGTGGSIENSQCRITGAGSLAFTSDARTLVLTL